MTIVELVSLVVAAIVVLGAVIRLRVVERVAARTPDRLRTTVRKALESGSLRLVHVRGCSRARAGRYNTLPEDCRCDAFSVQCLVLEREEID